MISVKIMMNNNNNKQKRAKHLSRPKSLNLPPTTSLALERGGASKNGSLWALHSTSCSLSYLAKADFPINLVSCSRILESLSSIFFLFSSSPQSTITLKHHHDNRQKSHHPSKNNTNNIPYRAPPSLS